MHAFPLSGNPPHDPDSAWSIRTVRPTKHASPAQATQEADRSRIVENCADLPHPHIPALGPGPPACGSRCRRFPEFADTGRRKRIETPISAANTGPSPKPTAWRDP
ncbi:hypothetical protein P355_0766 [Burkholderia cenocepacia KC-01]|nr:hypothetical protein P355_0766 [Burkholderia cenocepacia KC-01]